MKQLLGYAVCQNTQHGNCIVLFAKIWRQDTWNEALYMCLDYWVG